MANAWFTVLLELLSLFGFEFRDGLVGVVDFGVSYLDLLGCYFRF